MTPEKEYWISHAGAIWAEMEARINAAHAPVTAALLERVGIAEGMHVLDIGCGAGVSTRGAAVRAGAGGSVLALDVAPRLLDAARAHAPAAFAAPITYCEGDASEHPFPPGEADRVMSQFGTMFFADSVAAFGNIRRGARAGATLTMAAWGPLADNPWFALPRAVAAAHLPPVPSDPDGPGPLRFRDPAVVLGMLAEAGWHAPAVETLILDLTPPGSAADIARGALRMGPAARAVAHHAPDAATIERLLGDIEAQVARYQTPDGVRIPACVHFYSATA